MRFNGDISSLRFPRYDNFMQEVVYVMFVILRPNTHREIGAHSERQKLNKYRIMNAKYRILNEALNSIQY